MNVQSIENTPEALRNIMLWDAVEEEWRIGHLRHFPDVGVEYWCACTCREAADLITDGEPVPVFMRVTHWAQLPDVPK